MITSVYLINFRWHEFLGFCGTNHAIYEPKIKRMLITYWRLQNRAISLCLNVDCLCLFHKLLLSKKMILKLKVEILTLGSNWTKNQEHWAPIGEGCAEVSTDLGCTSSNETLSTCHDGPFMRFLSEKHPDASENSRCPYGSVRNIKSILSYKR